MSCEGQDGKVVGGPGIHPSVIEYANFLMNEQDVFGGQPQQLKVDVGYRIPSDWLAAPGRRPSTGESSAK